MKLKPAIVIVAFNRIIPLQRLVDSVLNAKFNSDDIPLIFSIDYDEDNKHIVEFINKVEWKHGKKQIILHSSNLGLRNHILKCGELSNKYGSVILLEDDLYVSKYFYLYAQESLSFFWSEDQVAGISLYNYEISESNNLEFEPLYDGSDNYFIQFPSSWGQIWTRKQWNSFFDWYKLNNKPRCINNVLPEFVSSWPETSWKKYFAAYLAINNLYFVYPRIGLSTNFGNTGTHVPNETSIYQINLQQLDIDYRFKSFSNSLVKYNICFELIKESFKKLSNEFNAFPDLELDFYYKNNYSSFEKYILTLRKSTKPLAEFNDNLKPLLNNILYNNMGSGICLTKVKNIKKEQSFRKDENSFFRILVNWFKYLLRILYYKVRFNINYERIK